MTTHQSEPEPSIRLVVWGTGAAAKDLTRRLHPGCEVVAYVDSNRTRWGTTFLGAPVVGPRSLQSRPKQAVLAFDRLVIASTFVSEIQRSLTRLRFDADRHPVLVWRDAGDGFRYPELFERQPIGVLQVGVTTRCNLRCGHCPRVHDSATYKDTDLATFTRHLSAFDPSQFHTLLVSDFGEVTVVKNFLEYLRAARRLGWQRMEFVTNATNGSFRLWDQVFSERLAAKIAISLEGIGAAFEEVRGFPWDRFSANVQMMTDANRRHSAGAEFLFNAVAMRSNLHALPDIVDFAAKHEAALSIVHLNPSNLFNNPLGLPDNHLDTVPRSEVVAVFREVVRRARRMNVACQLPEEFPELRRPAPRRAERAPLVSITERTTDLLCTQPLHWVEVDREGRVFPCCQMAKRFPVGNLNKHTFDEIWTGDRYRRLMEGLRPGGTPVDVCRTCNMYNGKRF